MFDFDYYQLTDLEKQITTLYQGMGFRKPEDLNETSISEQLGIKLLYANFPSMAYEDGNFRSITIRNNLSPLQQRENFFHELGHLLRGHTGDQSDMMELFRSLQEGQAEQFVLYAAMPFYMIQEFSMPMYERDVPYLFAKEFRVTERLALDRWHQIKRRISRSRWDKACIEYDRNRYKKADPANWSDDTKSLFRLAIQRKLQKGQGVIIR